MIERHQSLTPEEARNEEIEYLEKNNHIERVDDSHTDINFYCKRGHKVESLIVFTWFLKLDDEKNNLRKKALEAMEKENLTVFPFWKKKGLIEWLNKMTDWPIARQNVWGVKIPIWYDISDPSKFLVWFIDKKGKRQQGNLKSFLDSSITLEEISDNLEKIYTSETNLWTLKKEKDKNYIPETDTFDTWFFGGQWASIIFGEKDSADFNYFYPTHSIIVGQDLFRLVIARKVLLSPYLTGKLAFKTVYLHHLIKGKDGQKMSKSLGNDTSLDYYLQKFGADVTRMALISYTALNQDFIFADERMLYYKEFSDRLWRMGRIAENIKKYLKNSPDSTRITASDDSSVILLINRLSKVTSAAIERFDFASPQEKLCNFLSDLENYANSMKTVDDFYTFLQILKKYLTTLHPFMPFMTEELCLELFNFSAAKIKV